MTTRRRQQYLVGVLAWAVSVLLVLVTLQSLSYELYFVLTLIGVLVVTALTAPFNLTPRWRTRLRWVILLGLVVFTYLVFRRVLAVLPQGVFR
ncbi:hypothetical protein [Halorhabdus sp. BNX81]|uniref:hypothetical protein n=1 Tax=Halorhabdus sp. BNX81 TaxID=2980181 RepID=UPI0023DD20CF|nr:hypothetical protein [Halorhabdus sp. BNX81]WEL20587.1 putative membrane protein, a component ofa putative secretion system [Halorhabdus sp. BNX81]